ncbi:fatty-acyl-CoA synthase [Lipingzhangella halophila]|uniref:Fatty-acyl-CoA synthase n=1 Tax=Lipingzhangella halophila TaxID=1783352 RepID=A0A7W7RGK6_9ACTN|nr:long-chain fatty acid--CoA ligase [Lipingzhangella halophila]MBB4931608.1 fatty-acyl-CoA synthase [Lipingzhangella halophila]
MRNNGIGSWPARRARMAPDRVAIVHEDRTLNYDDLQRRVLRLAHALRGLGVHRGDRVAYLGHNHPSLLETLFAAGLIGAVFVPLNTRLATPELAYIVGDSGSSVLVYGPEHAETAEGLRERTVVREFVPVAGGGDTASGFEDLIAGSPEDPLDEPVELDDMCMIMYTSGTTGRPKGAVLTHGNITWNCVNVVIEVDLTADEVTLVSAPLFHTAALNMTCLPTLMKGGRVVITKGFDPEETIDLFTSQRITWMFGVPAMFNALAASPRWEEADVSSLRVLEAGGAPVPESTIETYQKRGLTFLQGYGMTETAPGALFLGAADSARKAGSAGKSSFFTNVRVVDENGRDTEPGQPGEIVVAGPNVMSGYWGRPDSTAAAFTNDGWFRTGDVATVDDEGYVYVVDRVKDMIISGGENIYPAEVENVLYDHPAVKEVAVIGVPDEKWGEAGRAIVVPREGTEATPQDLLDHCSGRLARYKIPKSVHFADALPRNASGKLLKTHLRQSHGDP